MTEAPPMRLRLDISYDGTDFAGWAAQPGLRTVAGVLSDALTVLFRLDVPLVVAGRTDAGVHASGQVAHIDVPRAALPGLTPRQVGIEIGVQGGILGLTRRLSGLLPNDVRVREISAAPDGFDARFSALRRHYRYRLGTAEWGVDPLRRKEIRSGRRKLDVASMSRAAAMLIGLHDFAAYCKPREGATTIRELQRLSVIDHGDEVDIEVTADAFCHSMVRALVGALIAVGEGRVDVGMPAVVLADRRRSSIIHTAAAHGLTLIGVDYPPDDQLAARSAQARATRGPEDLGENERR